MRHFIYVAGALLIALTAACGSSSEAEIDIAASQGVAEPASVESPQLLLTEEGRPCIETGALMEWDDAYLDEFFEIANTAVWYQVDPRSAKELNEPDNYLTHVVEGAQIAGAGQQGVSERKTDILVDDNSGFPLGLDVGDMVLVAGVANEFDPVGRPRGDLTFVRTSAGTWYPLMFCGSPRPPALARLAASHGYSGADADRWVLGLISTDLPDAIEVTDSTRAAVLQSLRQPETVVEPPRTWTNLAPNERALRDAPAEIANELEYLLVTFEPARDASLNSESLICTRTATGLGPCIEVSTLQNPGNPVPPIPIERRGQEVIEVLVDGRVVGEIPADLPANQHLRIGIEPGSIIEVTELRPPDELQGD